MNQISISGSFYRRKLLRLTQGQPKLDLCVLMLRNDDSVLSLQIGLHELSPKMPAALRLSLVFIALLICGAPVGDADEGPPDNESENKLGVAELIGRLDSDNFTVRRCAYLELLKRGDMVVAKLQDASKSDSIEQRYRIQRLIRRIRFDALKKSFARVVRRKDSAINLDEGMILISRILDLEVDQEAIEQQLDDLADAVRKRIGPRNPKYAPPEDVVEALVSVLRDDFKLSGNVDDYDDPRNSSLKHVFASRKGLPILISHVAVSVAQRLDVPIVGLAVPSRYMIKYDSLRAPLGHPTNDIIIDPFGNWRVLSVEEIKELIPSFNPDRDLVASPRRDTLARMLRNLASDLSGEGEADKAEETERILKLLQRGQNR